MKKIITIILTVTMLLICNICFAEENTKVYGLSEKIDSLFIKNSFSQEEINDIMKKWEERSIDLIKNSDAPWAMVIKPYGSSLNGKTKEESIAYIIDNDRPDFNNGFLISSLKNISYAKQYAENGHFDYLFSEKRYWNVLKNNDTTVAEFLLENGEMLDWNNFSNTESLMAVFSDETVNFLKDKDKISELLVKYGETSVLDIKILPYAGANLYIKCKNNEYIIDIYGGTLSNESVKDGIEPFALYAANEFFNIIEKNKAKYKNTLSDYVTPVKPIYETEATALQQEGLLNGNENGLDLLKPLTRAEAAAMIIRAMGQTEVAPDTSVQTFSDVPTIFWGYGATEKAYSLGIVDGIGDGLFAPNDTVTATQFSTMALRAANESDFDWQQAVNTLVERGLLTQEQTDTMDFFTRGDMAKIIYEAKANGMF